MMMIFSYSPSVDLIASFLAIKFSHFRLKPKNLLSFFIKLPLSCVVKLGFAWRLAPNGVVMEACDDWANLSAEGEVRLNHWLPGWTHVDFFAVLRWSLGFVISCQPEGSLHGVSQGSGTNIPEDKRVPICISYNSKGQVLDVASLRDWGQKVGTVEEIWRIFYDDDFFQTFRLSVLCRWFLSLPVGIEATTTVVSSAWLIPSCCMAFTAVSSATIQARKTSPRLTGQPLGCSWHMVDNVQNI